MNHRAASVIAAYALLALTVIPIFPHFLSPNEFTRWATAVAIVDLHTFELTRLLPVLGRDFEDLSVVHGRYYSNKAPGALLVGLPGYVVARAITGPPSPDTMRATVFAMRVVCATLPLVLLAICFVRVALKLGVEDPTIATVALLFGTPLFAYGMLNFSHALTAAALFAAWAFLFVTPSNAGDYAAGALIGLAAISEYPAGLFGAVLFVFAIGNRNVARIIGGGLPFAAGLATYNRAIFGSMFALSSGFERDAGFQRLAAHGLFGVSVPDPLVFVRLLFDPARGLFVFSPVLLAGLLAIPKARARMTPRQLWSLIVVATVIILFYAGYPNWHGGWTVGARYLVPAMPFLALLVAFNSSVVTSILLGASVAAVSVTAIVFPFVPADVPAPWATFAWPLLRHGLIAPNLLHFAGRALAIAFPIVVIAIAALKANKLWVVGGAVVWFAAALFVPLTPAARVERGFVEEVYFERDGAIARATPEGMHVAPAFIERARRTRSLPPPSWRF